jgi:hypothetical protein
MSQTQEKQEARSVTARAEDLLDRAGRGLGLFVASTGQRVQRATTAREKTDTHNAPEALNGKQRGQSASTKTEEANGAAMERADELVGQMEQRIHRFTALLNFNIQKTTARLREEAEDIWAEAQHIRSQGRRKPQ